MTFLLVIISCVFGGEWTETGSTGFPLFDVGVNSGILQYSTELYSQGSWIVSTNDLGSTWDVLLRQNDGFMDIAVSSFNDKYAVVNSLLGRVLYTKDSGNTWDTSVDPVFGVQGFSRTRDNSMIYGGAGGDKVHLSYDYGRRWNSSVIGNLSFGARYIAMPSKDVWYITAGLWIEDEQYNKDDWLHFTSKIYINKHNGNVQFRNSKDKSKRRRLQPENKMWAAIYKTEDAGNTWKQLYFSEDLFYFNGIDCCDINTCYAVAEGDSESGSNDPGSRIFMTTNGESFTQVLHDNDDAASLMTVHCLNNEQPYEAYCGGGDIEGGRGFGGYFFYTNNNGNSFSNITFKAPIMWMDMSDDGQYGLATGISKTSGGVSYGYQ